MTTTSFVAPVRRSITVKATQKKAFEAFTSDLGRWWPARYSIGSSALKTATMEPREGGRWYETGEDGSECEWGEVLAWEPPSRVLLAWRIGADWKFYPDLLTEVEVRFIPLADGSTRVELEHRLLENYGEHAEAACATLDSEGGWTGLLGSYAVTVEKADA